jgi:LmbE family N-acetylglucosaminyl deacetylase
VLALELPRGRRPLRVLCLGAHADDVEIGCGGTVLSLVAERRVALTWLVFSADGARAAEARASAEAFGRGAAALDVQLEAFRDGYFPAEFVALKERFERLRRSVEPDLIFTHARDDLHQDHRTVAELTWNTFRDHCILEYEIPKYDGDLGRPNAYRPLPRRVAERKARLLTTHFRSQLRRDWFTAETFLGLMRLRGVECRAADGYAEAFHGRKLVF